MRHRSLWSGDESVAGTVFARNFHAPIADEGFEQAVERAQQLGIAMQLEGSVLLDQPHALILYVTRGGVSRRSSSAAMRACVGSKGCCRSKGIRSSQLKL